MWQVKPVTAQDLPALESLMNLNPLRLSTLPTERDQLAERIAVAESGFAGLDDKATLLFGLHEDNGNMVGVCGIQPYAGADEPFYSYRIDELVHASRHLKIHQRQPVLYLSHELTGLTSLCSFTMLEKLRSTAAFDLLTRSRLMYIAAHREHFADELICEIQGIWDDQGQSIFWKSVGELFFGLDFITADNQCALHGKTIIAELLPPYPIYTTLLPEAVRKALAEPHPRTERTIKWLQQEGLVKSRYIDPFDGGPTYRGEICKMNSIRAIRNVSGVRQQDGLDSQQWLVSQGHGTDFICMLVEGALVDDMLLSSTQTILSDNTPTLVMPLELQHDID
ncbi:arginine N-succinyltransferase [Nitrincola alkalilacustris]|uniref:arginine N-succinyltransferase n=1 Tax=Nitrincola alkalilacustris TaxID=1571224 RepID=UPI001457408B|nr:arginine N-succinyltransferase [Nitrincola alkalilacustris]